MKKLVLIAILSLVPFTAFALDAMDDSALDKVTAQEGVTITFNAVEINQAAEDIAWGDADGLNDAGVTTGGYIFMSSNAGNTISLDGTSLTIDVATAVADIAVGAETITAGTTFIALGLPSVTIGYTERTTTITLDDAVNATGFPEPAAEALGSLYQNTTGNTTISGDIYIYAHE